jgi:hypothetical protein
MALALAALAGCGGDGKSCVGGAACGGTIAAGRYKISSFCAAGGTQMVQGCSAGISLDLSGISFTGTMTFNADKTYQTDTTGSGTFAETIPTQCLGAGTGASVDCSKLGQGALSDPDTAMIFSAITCSGTTACTCSFTLKPQHEMAAGTYSTSGTTLTLSPVAGEPDSGGYCATPTQLTLTSDMGMAGMMGMPEMGSPQSNLVLTKE